MTGVYLNDWAGADAALLEVLFALPAGALAGLRLLIASYSHDQDSGYAFILYQDDNQQLFEVNASHDSILDFNGQWQPEETSVEALLFRMNKGNLGKDSAGHNLFNAELRDCLTQLMA